MIAYAVCMFLIYILIPFIVEISSAPFLNVNLLTADFYSVLVGIFIKKYKVVLIFFNLI
jgi:solute carrier family 35 protein F1/2